MKGEGKNVEMKDVEVMLEVFGQKQTLRGKDQNACSERNFFIIK